MVLRVAMYIMSKLTFHTILHDHSGGSPLGYFDWAMIQQGVFAGIESVAIFGGAAAAMEYCFRKGFISKFP